MLPEDYKWHTDVKTEVDWILRELSSVQLYKLHNCICINVYYLHGNSKKNAAPREREREREREKLLARRRENFGLTSGNESE